MAQLYAEVPDAIVRIHDVGRVEQTVFISMELIEGRSLREPRWARG